MAIRLICSASRDDSGTGEFRIVESNNTEADSETGEMTHIGKVYYSCALATVLSLVCLTSTRPGELSHEWDWENSHRISVRKYLTRWTGVETTTVFERVSSENVPVLDRFRLVRYPKRVVRVVCQVPLRRFFR